MKINLDAPYDEATRVAIEVLRAYGFSLSGLNLYMHMFEPAHMIFYAYQWPNGEWTGELQAWNEGQDEGHITTKETYATQREALAAILGKVKLTDAPCTN